MVMQCGKPLFLTLFKYAKSHNHPNLRKSGVSKRNLIEERLDAMPSPTLESLQCHLHIIGLSLTHRKSATNTFSLTR